MLDIIGEDSVEDHYAPNPPRMLVVVFCVGAALFIGAAGAGVAWLIRTRF